MAGPIDPRTIPTERRPRGYALRPEWQWKAVCFMAAWPGPAVVALWAIVVGAGVGWLWSDLDVLPAWRPLPAFLTVGALNVRFARGTVARAVEQAGSVSPPER